MQTQMDQLASTTGDHDNRLNDIEEENRELKEEVSVRAECIHIYLCSYNNYVCMIALIILHAHTSTYWYARMPDIAGEDEANVQKER